MRTLYALLLLGLVTALGAQVEFSQLDLAQDNSLVFRARSQSPGFGSFDSFFLGDVAKNTIQALTFYPERMSWIPQTKLLQIQNRYGIFRFDPTKGTLSQNPTGFVSQQTVSDGKVIPILSSPDGLWHLTLDPISDTKANLVLLGSEKGTKAVISQGVLLNLREVPASWSLDSQFVVYEKDSRIYYYSLKQQLESRIPTEDLRQIGPGFTSSLYWTSSGELIYVWEDVVYRILPEEFFTRSLYGGMFRLGSVLGKLPRVFDPARDRFWLSPDKSQILLNWTGRSLFLYPLDGSDFYQSGTLVTYSYLPLPQNMTISKVFWPSNAAATLLVTTLQEGKRQSQLLRIEPQGTRLVLGTGELFNGGALSPDQTLLALVTDKGITVRTYSNMEEKVKWELPQARHVLWISSTNLIAASKDQVVELVPATKLRTTLLLAGADRMGFNPSGRLVAQQGTKYFLHKGQGIWEPSESTEVFQEPLTVNANYRAFVNELSSTMYRNQILVRQLTGVGNTALFPVPMKTYSPFPNKEEPLTTEAFTHGSRLRARQVTLLIRAQDQSDGLTQALASLAEYGWRTTILVGGEFLRRNPGASLEIAASGHQTGSLFHLDMDLTDRRFVIDSEFLRRGLARMEDDWFRVTQKELGLVWQAPGYFYNAEAAKATQLMNYTYVGRDVIYTLPSNKEVLNGPLIEEILQKIQPGSIVPLTLGTKDSTTGQSFFDHLDLLLNALQVRGYQVVPLNKLMENSKK